MAKSCTDKDVTPAEREAAHEAYKDRVLKAITDLERVIVETSPCDAMLKEGIVNYASNAVEMMERLAVGVALLQSGVAGEPYQGGSVQIHPPKLGGLS